MINPFLQLKFDKVLMYDYMPAGHSGLIVDENTGSMHVEKIRKQIELDALTVKEINARIGDVNMYGQDVARCFIPHLGFVYFLNTKIVCHVSICLQCNILRSSIDIPIQTEKIFGNGMSKSFRKFLNDLLVKNDFSHQIQPNSGFDD